MNAPWLVRLRWVAVIGQLLTIGAVWGVLRIDLPMISLLTVLMITAVSNLAFGGWVYSRNRQSDDETSVKWESGALTAIMGLDLILLTALLYFSGGPSNPFAVFFFVNLSLCAFVLNRGSAWALNLLAVVCYSTLLFAHKDLPILDPSPSLRSVAETSNVTLLQWGSLLAFIACGSVIVHFTSRLHDEVRHQEAELRDAESQHARSEKLEALGTLAAGAAHELATPLSTIAVVAREFEKQLSAANVRSDWLDDVALIRGELDRCRTILDQMSSDAGRSVGEQIRSVTGGELAQEILAGLSCPEQVKSQITDEAAQARLLVPLRGLAQAIRGLVNNAIHASPAGVSVVVDTTLTSPWLVLNIRDRGPGMSEAILRRLSEPFFTTKEPGEGMGLGVFLARTTIERIGGALEIESIPQQGTTVRVALPTHPSPLADSGAPHVGP